MQRFKYYSHLIAFIEKKKTFISNFFGRKAFDFLWNKNYGYSKMFKEKQKSNRDHTLHRQRKKNKFAQRKIIPEISR